MRWRDILHWYIIHRDKALMLYIFFVEIFCVEMYEPALKTAPIHVTVELQNLWSYGNPNFCVDCSWRDCVRGISSIEHYCVVWTEVNHAFICVEETAYAAWREYCVKETYMLQPVIVVYMRWVYILRGVWKFFYVAGVYMLLSTSWNAAEPVELPTYQASLCCYSLLKTYLKTDLNIQKFWYWD